MCLFFLCIFLLRSPLILSEAAAWKFRADPICTLTHETGEAAITITFDRGLTEYRLDLTLTGAEWAPTPSFGMAFEGARGLTIGTDRHLIEGTTLTVTDSGFGNVLNGLEFNRIATAFTPEQSAHFPLDGAAEPMRKFRRCAKAAPATSRAVTNPRFPGRP